MRIYITSFCFLVLLASCAEEGKVLDVAVAKMQAESSDTFRLDLLLFKAEKVLEVWQLNETKNAKFLSRFSLNGYHHWPIGRFEWQKKDTTTLVYQFPNSFYSQKQRIAIVANQALDYATAISPALSKDDQKQLLDRLGSDQPGRLLIFPNKPSKNEDFKACLNCPHWTAELYAILELEIKNYPINHGN